MDTHWRVLMDGDRKRLAAAMDSRRLELRLRWKKVAELAGMSEANLLRIRNDEISLTTFAAAGIEAALQWEKDSVLAVLEGGEPVPLQREHAPPDAELDELIASARRELDRAQRALADLERERQRQASA